MFVYRAYPEDMLQPFPEMLKTSFSWKVNKLPCKYIQEPVRTEQQSCIEHFS